MKQSVSVIIPAYHEEAGIKDVIEKIDTAFRGWGYEFEIIVVDDGSTDSTARRAQEGGARVISHNQNRGYGASLKTGIRAARFDTILINDADATYPLEPIPEMLEKIEDYDMVVGARITKNVKIPLIRRPAKWMLKKLSEYIVNQPIPDLNSGLRVFKRKVVMDYFPILSNKFSFTTTVTVAMLSNYNRVLYVPIDYHKRVGQSKIVPWDFVNFIVLILRLSMLFRPLRVFAPLGVLCFCASFLKFIWDIGSAIYRAGGFSLAIFANPIISTSSLILFLSGLQILLVGMVCDGIIRKIEQMKATSPLEIHR